MQNLRAVLIFSSFIIWCNKRFYLYLQNLLYFYSKIRRDTMNFALLDFSSINFLQTQSLVFFFHKKSRDYILNIFISILPNYLQVILYEGINTDAFGVWYTGSNCYVADYFYIVRSGTFSHLLVFAGLGCFLSSCTSV